MKKVFTLFAAALLGLCAFAQEGPCPSRLYFEPAADEQPANNATFLLKLVNSSENLNGFNMEVQKPEAAVWVEDADDEDWVGFSGYGHTILARWEGVTDSKREQQLFKKTTAASSQSLLRKTTTLSQDSLLTSRLAVTQESPSSLCRMLLLKDARSLTLVV